MEDILELADDIVTHAIPELEKYWAFNVKTGDQYTLNETAYFVLAHFVEPTAGKVVLNHFLAEFEVSPEVGERDYRDILLKYLTEGILKRR